MPNFYITPTGAGNKSGSDWANAAAITSMDGAVRKAGAGGTVYLAADQGSYKVTNGINIWSGASYADEVTIKGVNSRTGAEQEAVIEGTRPAVYKAGNPSGNELFKLQKGAGNLAFENLQVNNTATVFRAAGDVSNITIRDVDAENVAHFFQTYIGSGNKTASVTGLVLKNIEVNGFSKGLIDIAYDSSNIVIEDVHGDSERQDGDEFAIGVHLRDTVHDVVIRRTVMENATDTIGGNYWNGDGFATEAKVYSVLFEDTVARGNTDAGYDLKSKATVLVRAMAEDNSRNFRIWGETEMIDVVGLNPDKRGGALNAQNQVHVLKGATLTINGGHFADAGSGTRVFLNEGGTVSINDVEIVRASTGVLKTGTIGGLDGAKITLVDAAGKNSMGMAFDFASTEGQVIPPVGTTLVLPERTDTVAPVPAPFPTPVVVSPPAPVKVAPPAVAPVPAGFKFLGTAGVDTFTGSTGADQFRFDQTVNRGTDRITGFGSDDVVITRKALADGNGDGIITVGRNGLFDLGGGGGTLKVDGLTKGLRLLGETEEGFVYGSAGARPVKAQEGKLGRADTLTGDAKDKVVNTFFFDNELHMDLGRDKVINFGTKDVIVTTSRLGDGTKLAAGTDGSFDFADHLGSISIIDVAGQAVNMLEFDGEQVAGGVHYFLYSLVESATSHMIVGA